VSALFRPTALRQENDLTMPGNEDDIKDMIASAMGAKQLIHYIKADLQAALKGF
jgi:hypothetical protein